MKLNAIIFGATGMVGEGVLHVTLSHPETESVLVVGRRPCGVRHPKLRELVTADFTDLSPVMNQLREYNACFFCAGTTSLGKSEEEYTRVTYDLTMGAAGALARANSGITFCYVSGAGTDGTERGRLMWARVKGRTENDLAKLPFRAVYNFRPGFIKPIPGLKNAFALARLLGGAYPLWKALMPNYVCTLEDLGLAMIHAVERGYARTVLENRDIATLAR